MDKVLSRANHETETICVGSASSNRRLSAQRFNEAALGKTVANETDENRLIVAAKIVYRNPNLNA